MKTLQICIPTGILFTIALLFLALNTQSSIEYRYNQCLESLMENYEIASEELALEWFEDLAAAKAKILEADQILDQVNRMSEGPLAPATQSHPQNKRAYAQQLQSEAKQILIQLEQIRLANN